MNKKIIKTVVGLVALGGAMGIIALLEKKNLSRVETQEEIELEITSEEIVED